VQVLHHRNDGRDVLASDVEVADTLLGKARGLMFRRDIAEDYGLVFEFDEANSRSFHMLFVPFPIDVVWLTGEEVTAVKRLRPWIGLGRASGDRAIELSAGAAADVEPGDRVTIER
jgi:uncharacterized membrane protein (UPF0127 family)